MRIRYFAWIRQRTGCGEETITLPEGIATLEALKQWLGERHPRFGELLASPGIVRCAVNYEHVAGDQPIGPDDEVAFFPPVTGG